MKEKIITFIPTTSTFGLEPIPSVRNVPAWYKKMPRYKNNEKKFIGFRGENNFTIKACIPFLDALTIGYQIVLQADMFVQTIDGEPDFSWRKDGTIIAFHPIEQIPNITIPPEYHSVACKFLNDFIVEMPKGYSILFTQPFNRTDLPFYTLTGLVDCDTFDITVNFPFFIRKDFEGIIEAGTPIAQLIPIKRENWKHKIKTIEEKQIKNRYDKFFTKYINYYKNNNWVRKEYN